MNINRIFYKLRNINVDTAPEDEVRDLLRHFQNQMNTTYLFWVGEWANARRVKSTRTGRFVGRADFIRVLNHHNNGGNNIIP